MGKTQKGALWLDENKCSVYDFYQYFRNVEDCKVAECMRLLTFMDMKEIEELTRYQDERINAAKARLAYEVTKLVHEDQKTEHENGDKNRNNSHKNTFLRQMITFERYALSRMLSLPYRS